MEQEKCNVCNHEGGHHNLCPNNIVNSDIYEYQISQIADRQNCSVDEIDEKEYQLMEGE